MSATTERVLITDPSFGNGWFEDPESGKKTRKQDGDRVVTRAEYDEMLSIAQGGDESKVKQAGEAADQVRAAMAERETARQETVDAAATQAPVQLTSGKLAVGKTTTIQCAWVDQANRTPAQQKLLDTNFEGVEAGKSFEAVKKAAGGKAEAAPCGESRTIKVQDLFQVRFCTEHQKAWRNELRRRKTAARRAERKATNGTPAEA